MLLIAILCVKMKEAGVKEGGGGGEKVFLEHCSTWNGKAHT